MNPRDKAIRDQCVGALDDCRRRIEAEGKQRAEARARQKEVRVSTPTARAVEDGGSVVDVEARVVQDGELEMEGGEIRDVEPHAPTNTARQQPAAKSKQRKKTIIHVALEKAMDESRSHEGPGSIFLPGVGTIRRMTAETKNYSLRKNLKGKRIVISLNTDDVEEAIKRAQHESDKLVEKHARGEPLGAEAGRIKVRHLFDAVRGDYKAENQRSLDRVEDAITHLLSRFKEGDKAISITSLQLKKYLEKRRKEGAADGTIRYELAIFRRGFTLCMSEFELEIRGKVYTARLPNRPQFPRIKVNNARQGSVYENEFSAILEHLPKEVRPVAECAYYTGWRKSEVVNLEWRRVDFRTGTMNLEPGTTKNDEARAFPFHVLPPLKDLLERQRAYTDNVEEAKGVKIPWVFHRNGARIKSFKGAWTKAVEAAGVPHIIFHDLRRTAVNNLENAGVSRSTAMQLTGHKTESVYTRYATPKRRELEEGVAKLAALHGENPLSPSPSVEPRKVAVGSRGSRKIAGGNIIAFRGRS